MVFSFAQYDKVLTKHIIMRILILIDDLVSGGAQRQNVGLAKLLRDRGYEVKLIYYHPIEFYKKFLDENGVDNECVRGASNPWKRMAKIAKAVRDYEPPFVISYLDTPNIIVCVLKMLGVIRCPVLVSERNTTQQLSIRERVKYFLMRWANYIVPNSYSQEKFIRDHYPKLFPKVSTITNFVDTSVFVPGRSRDYSQNRILCVARVAEQKNVLRFIQALSLLKQRGKIFTIDWFGYVDKEYYKKCKEAISQCGLGDEFHFREPSHELVGEYQQCAFFCLPSVYEGFPNVVCEAMSCGSPIVCSNICDNPLIVNDGKNGYVFNPYDVENMADVMEKYMNLDEEVKDQMGHESRILAEQNFSSTKFVGKYIKLIEKQK